MSLKKHAYKKGFEQAADGEPLEIPGLYFDYDAKARDALIAEFKRGYHDFHAGKDQAPAAPKPTGL